MTTVTYELDLTQFKFWGGAVETVKYLTYSELEELNAFFNDNYEVLSETDVNDIFWFEDDALARYLGYDDFEALMNRDDEEEEDEEEDEE